MTVVLAADLGGTKTSLALVDEEGRIRARTKAPAARTLEGSVEQIAGAAASARAESAGFAGPMSVGVIVPGIYTPGTGRAWCPNLWGADDVPLRDALESRLGASVVIDSDRAGYVLGESWLGVARGLRDVAFVAIGTGIGVGILSNGAVVRGAHGVAGAAGWFALTLQWKDAYGRVGCWEAEAAGPAVARLAGAADAASVVEAARSGDPAARAVLAAAARYTGMGVANLISVLDPEMVVLGGGLMQGSGDLLLDDVRREAARWAQPVAHARCRIEVTELGEDAGLLGAARLALGRV